MQWRSCKSEMSYSKNQHLKIFSLTKHFCLSGYKDHYVSIEKIALVFGSKFFKCIKNRFKDTEPLFWESKIAARKIQLWILKSKVLHETIILKWALSFSFILRIYSRSGNHQLVKLKMISYISFPVVIIAPILFMYVTFSLSDC